MDTIERKIKELFPKLLKENLMSFSNMVVPQHKHNRVDSPAIDSFDINTNNSRGFVFGTADNMVSIYYDPATKTFLIYESDMNVVPKIPLIIGNFKSINIQAAGTSVGDHSTMSFGDPLKSYVKCDATGTSTGATDGIDTAISKLTSTLQQYLSTGDFALQLPVSTLPSPVPGMIAFDGTDFRGVDSSGTWKTFQLT